MIAPGIVDMESDVLAADEMAEALFGLLERGVVQKGLSVSELSAVLCCVVHLQAHTGAIKRAWQVAIGEKLAAA